MLELYEVRAVWLEQTGQFGLAVEMHGPHKAAATGRVRLLPGDSTEQVVKALRELANALEQSEKIYNDAEPGQNPSSISNSPLSGSRK